MLSAALSAGLCSVGIDVVSPWRSPPPLLSLLSPETGEFAKLGAIISASHNPAPDNGIKFVGTTGRKLSDEVEETIESLPWIRLKHAQRGWHRNDHCRSKRHRRIS